MPTSHPLHPIAEKRLTELVDELERDFSRTHSDRQVLNALVYSATAAQAVGMLEAFARDRRMYNDAHQGQPGEKQRSIGGR
jgi:hypothetical protein